MAPHVRNAGFVRWRAAALAATVLGATVLGAAACGPADPVVVGGAAEPVAAAEPDSAPGLGLDPHLAAADELLARWHVGEARAWRVDERYSRTRGDGQVLTWDLTVVRHPPDVLVVGGGFVHGVVGGRVVTCERGPAGSTCTEPGAPSTFDPASALDDQLDPATSAVRAGLAAVIAGEPVDCYTVTARAGAGERRLGDHAELCLTADGIPLRVVISRGTIVERREAVAVSRDVDGAEVTALLAGA